MITVTELAATQIKKALAESNKTLKTAVLRIFVQGGGCSGFQYGLAVEDAPQETDKVLESNGVRIAVDPISIRYLEGAVVDFVDGLTGGFKINNPNAQSTCGCGQSFGV